MADLFHRLAPERASSEANGRTTRGLASDFFGPHYRVRFTQYSFASLFAIADIDLLLTSTCNRHALIWRLRMQTLTLDMSQREILCGHGNISVTEYRTCVLFVLQHDKRSARLSRSRLLWKQRSAAHRCHLCMHQSADQTVVTGNDASLVPTYACSVFFRLDKQPQHFPCSLRRKQIGYSFTLLLAPLIIYPRRAQTCPRRHGPQQLLFRRRPCKLPLLHQLLQCLAAAFPMQRRPEIFTYGPARGQGAESQIPTKRLDQSTRCVLLRCLRSDSCADQAQIDRAIGRGCANAQIPYT